MWLYQRNTAILRQHLYKYYFEEVENDSFF